LKEKKGEKCTEAPMDCSNYRKPLCNDNFDRYGNKCIAGYKRCLEVPENCSTYSTSNRIYVSATGNKCRVLLNSAGQKCIPDKDGDCVEMPEKCSHYSTNPNPVYVRIEGTGCFNFSNLIGIPCKPEEENQLNPGSCVEKRPTTCATYSETAYGKLSSEECKKYKNSAGEKCTVDKSGKCADKLI
jgi:hypothetical protein